MSPNQPKPDAAPADERPAVSRDPRDAPVQRPTPAMPGIEREEPELRDEDDIPREREPER